MPRSANAALRVGPRAGALEAALLGGPAGPAHDAAQARIDRPSGPDRVAPRGTRDVDAAAQRNVEAPGPIAGAGRLHGRGSLGLHRSYRRAPAFLNPLLRGRYAPRTNAGTIHRMSTLVSGVWPVLPTP